MRVKSLCLIYIVLYASYFHASDINCVSHVLQNFKNHG